jgi:hypothetical protein
MTTISIIGSGNMATAIGTRAAKHGHTIREGGVLVPHVARQLIARVAQGQDLAGLLSSSDSGRQATRMASTLGDTVRFDPRRACLQFLLGYQPQELQRLRIAVARRPCSCRADRCAVRSSRVSGRARQRTGRATRG